MSVAGRSGGTAAVHVRAPGKVNLGLAVGRRQPDGYHPLATVFQAVSVHDQLVATPADGLSVKVTGLHAAQVPSGDDNLAARAAQLLADRVGMAAGVHLHLHKAIPLAGGMAGGSADAAAALLACDSLWATGLSREELRELAAALGSDVPFALHGQTAIGRGRGHLLSPVLARGEYHWALGLHRSGLATQRVYEMFDELLGDAAPVEPEVDPALMRALRSGDAARVGAALSNDLQPAALELAPGLAETLSVAQDAGALGVVVSGSGPTVAALASSRRQARSIAAALLAAGVVDDAIEAAGPVPGARVLSEPEGVSFPDWA